MRIFKNKKKLNYFKEDKDMIKKIKAYKEQAPIPEIDPQKNLEKIMEKLENRITINSPGYKYKIAVFAIIFICIIGLLFLLNGRAKKNNKYKIDELRTEFVISGTDIKILWIQKKDFDLNKLKANDNKKNKFQRRF